MVFNTQRARAKADVIRKRIESSWVEDLDARTWLMVGKKTAARGVPHPVTLVRQGFAVARSSINFATLSNTGLPLRSGAANASNNPTCPISG